MSVVQLDRQHFVEKYGGVFEHSPWVAEGAYDRGLGTDGESAEGLHGKLCAVVRDADRDAKLALLRAHPDLAGRLAQAGALTADSTQEQAGAGLDQLTAEELAIFTDLNRRYVERFGFPFIIAVKGLDKQAIQAAFETRVMAAPDAEFATALAQVERIALLRLQGMMA